jgi:hypothetical protein
MPLLDHSHALLCRKYPWRGFLGTWAANIARQLNADPLPPGYHAMPLIDREGVRVEVFADDGDPRLAAAVDLVSPRNKDRPRARQAFAAKCAGHLRCGCGVVVVDVVTTRRTDLHADLLAELGVEATEPPSAALSAVSYRAVGREDGLLQVWPAVLEVGRPLPMLPLWLGGEFSVPLHLEVSHAAACDDLRIRQAG